MIDYRQVRYFLALAEYLHFGKAAASLHLAQPSLSRQIAALEEALGCQLVLRSSRSVALTAAGRELQRTASQVVAGFDSAIRSTQAVARGDRGELKIGFTSMVAWTGFPRMMREFSDAHPSVNLVLNELLPNDLARSVETGENDLYLSFKPLGQSTLQYHALQAETLCIALPADHPLAGNARVALADLSHSGFILSPRSTAPALFDQIMALCQGAGFEPVVRMHTHLQGTILNLVAEGLGVSIVPQAMAKPGFAGVRFFPVAGSPEIELGVSWSGANSNPCLRAFLRGIGVATEARCR